MLLAPPLDSDDATGIISAIADGLNCAVHDEPCRCCDKRTWHACGPDFDGHVGLRCLRHHEGPVGRNDMRGVLCAVGLSSRSDLSAICSGSVLASRVDDLARVEIAFATPGTSSTADIFPELKSLPEPYLRIDVRADGIGTPQVAARKRNLFRTGASRTCPFREIDRWYRIMRLD